MILSSNAKLNTTNTTRTFDVISFRNKSLRFNLTCVFVVKLTGWYVCRRPRSFVVAFWSSPAAQDNLLPVLCEWAGLGTERPGHLYPKLTENKNKIKKHCKIQKQYLRLNHIWNKFKLKTKFNLISLPENTLTWHKRFTRQ